MRHFLKYLLVCVLITACQTSNPPLTRAPQLAAVSTPTDTIAPLDPNKWRHPSELGAFFGGSSSPVAALAFTEDARELLVVHGGRAGVLQRWRVEGGVLSNTIALGPVGMAAVGFDAKASLVAIGAGVTAPAVARGYGADFEGAHLWDTHSGQEVLRTVTADQYYGLPATDVALNPSGQLLAIVDSGGLEVWDTRTKKDIDGVTVTGEIKKDSSRTQITSVAIDPTGRWIAYANDGGTVGIEDRVQNHPIWWTWNQYGGIPLALAFDASGSWLAAITSDSLVLWDLKTSTSNTVFKTVLPDTPLANLVFSPDSSLLAFGTSNGWQIWSVPEQKLLTKNEQPTYAVAFSPDGRLFAWGDTSGVVHIWGAKE